MASKSFFDEDRSVKDLERHLQTWMDSQALLRGDKSRYIVKLKGWKINFNQRPYYILGKFNNEFENPSNLEIFELAIEADVMSKTYIDKEDK